MNNLACFLAKIIRAQLYKEPLPEIPEGITVEQVVTIACENQMIYMIVSALLQMKVDDKLEPVLKQLVFKSMSKTLMQVNELKALQQAFEESGIVNQPMKGSVMRFIYPKPELREMGDIDILVNEIDIKRAQETLEQLGYVCESEGRQHDVYRKKPHMCVEVHKAMFDKHLDNNQYEYFKDISKRELRMGCQYTYDFSKEDYYVYMMAHMAKHFYVKGCGIRNLIDVYVYKERFAKEMNWEYVNAELEKCGIRDYTEHMERLAQIWLGEEESTPFYNHLFDYMMNSGIHGKTENSIWAMVAREQQARENVTRFQVMLWNFFPTYEYMVKWFNWLEGRRYLLPVAWGIRAFRGVFMRKRLRQRENAVNLSEQDIQIYGEIYRKVKLPFDDKN